MTLPNRAAIVQKIEDLKVKGYVEGCAELGWLREQLKAVDKQLLLAEVERLKQQGCSFEGTCLEEMLGVDRWLLS